MKIVKNKYLSYFEKIYLIRKTELEISKRYRQKKMRCPIHLSVGQEAPSAAINVLLNKTDFAISYHRAHAHYLAKGCSLPKMIAEIYGKKTGCSSGYGGSMHLIDKKNNFIGSTAIVSSSIPVGAGFAYSLLRKKNKAKVCIYIGDASCEEGVFFETLNFVILKKLPVIFFCENNKYSVYSSLSKRQPKNRKLFKMASAMGIKSFHASSSNPIKLLDDLEKIINKNEFPLFIEVDTYRFLEHCGPDYDDYLKYRPKNEVKYWFDKDSLALVEKFIIKKNIYKLQFLNKIKNKIDKSINTAFEFAEKSESPNYNEFLKMKL
jgi:pyruvate dehydrogenase E1 component alpha subunit